MSMDIEVKRVTPRLAEQWLNGSNINNRKLREGVAEKYADDMRNGRWTQCPEPISFYDDGTLADGQHRLWAIIESECTIPFPIARGLTRSDGLNLNTGLTRTLVDNARISGTRAGLTNETLGVARALAEGGAPGKASSAAERLAQVDVHEAAIAWAVANGPRGQYLRNMLVLAAVARAWYYETDTDRLKRFCDVLSSGFAQGDEESAAIALRNYLKDRGPLSSSAALWRESFLKVQNAIRYFMQGKKLTVIKTVKDEAYPAKKPRGK